MAASPPQPPAQPNPFHIEAGPLFAVGVSLAVVGNALIACSLTLQKYCVNREVTTGVKTQQMPLFWASLVGMIGGEIGNFTAFGFASQTVVSPLGAVSVIMNAILAAAFLDEEIYRRTVLGIALTLLGSVAIVLFSPPPLNTLTPDDFVELLANPYAYGYLIVVAVAIMLLWLVERKLAARFVLIDIGLCSLLGSITVICSTGVSKFIVGGQFVQAVQSPVLYVLVVLLATTAVLQLRFLNKAMEHFPSAVVVPTYYVTFTLSSIAGGVWVFDEAWRPHSWLTPIPQQEYFFFLGCLVSFCGVGLIAIKPADAEGAAAAATTPDRRGGGGSGTGDGGGTSSASGATEDDAPPESLARAHTFSPTSATSRPQLSHMLSVFAAGSAAGDGLAAQGRANSAGALPDASAWWYDASAPLATADLRGGVNVVTGVGTMQHLYCAFGSRRGTAVEPLAGLAVEPADVPGGGPPSDGALSASLIRNDHGHG